MSEVLKSIFSNIDSKTIEKVLKEEDGDLESASARLHQLSSAWRTTSSEAPREDFKALPKSRKPKTTAEPAITPEPKTPCSDSDGEDSGPSSAAGKCVIFWDLDNVPLPIEGNSVSVIIEVLREMFNPREIIAYADCTRVPRRHCSDLNYLRVKLRHAPSGDADKDLADKALTSDMMEYMGLDHNKGATFVLMSGDRDYSAFMHLLVQHGIRVKLIHRTSVRVRSALIRAAEEVFSWEEILQTASNRVGTAKPGGKVPSSSARTSNPDDSLLQRHMTHITTALDLLRVEGLEPTEHNIKMALLRTYPLEKFEDKWPRLMEAMGRAPDMFTIEPSRLHPAGSASAPTCVWLTKRPRWSVVDVYSNNAEAYSPNMWLSLAAWLEEQQVLAAQSTDDLVSVLMFSGPPEIGRLRKAEVMNIIHLLSVVKKWIQPTGKNFIVRSPIDTSSIRTSAASTSPKKSSGSGSGRRNISPESAQSAAAVTMAPPKVLSRKTALAASGGEQSQQQQQQEDRSAKEKGGSGKRVIAPKILAKPASTNDLADANNEATSATVTSTSPTPVEPQQQPAQKLPPNWMEFNTPEGKKYYYNTVTKASSWRFPTS